MKQPRGELDLERRHWLRLVRAVSGESLRWVSQFRGRVTTTESLILAQDERWRRA